MRSQREALSSIRLQKGVRHMSADDAQKRMQKIAERKEMQDLVTQFTDPLRAELLALTKRVHELEK